MATTTRPGRRIGALLAGLTLAVLAGCKEEKIGHYKVPKPPQQRLLGAIIPHDRQTWFFKLLGPQPAVDKHAEEFKQFVNSVRFPDKGEKPITWTLSPDWGWEEEAGSGERYATFKLGRKDAALELTVIPLGGRGGTLLSNVNRWRDQMGLLHVSEAELDKLTSELKLPGDIKGTWVDIKSADELGRGGKGAKP